jgi:CheY-like chemotaxis protein
MTAQARARMAEPLILIVEDEALVAMLIEDTVGDLGCRVAGPVANVADGLAILEREVVDGAILDVNLGGRELVYPLAEALSARGIPFVFVTGYGAEGLDPRFSSTPVLQKPFHPATLEKMVLHSLLGSAGPRADL